jgi:hypothetical protein
MNTVKNLVRFSVRGSMWDSTWTRVLAVIMLLCYPIHGKDALCDKALSDCTEVIQAQNTIITTLKQQNEVLKEQVLAEQHEPTLPTWAWVVISVASGVFLGHIIH